ncbi:hypothetical protein RUM44_006844 [Polyplax serrata]|uniref:SUMO-activating enzyme subunit 1 n=1 Tax=Polyplax serrata TaxID=468196 RepID=A0ABR1AJ85_POLSC
MVTGQTFELTEDEAELYDRQIRLWGLDSQNRLRKSRVLIIGVKGFGAEIAKNIILSGVKSVVLLDDGYLVEEDTCSQFLAPVQAVGSYRAEASLARAQALNPMVAVKADTGKLQEKSDVYFKDFDVVVATECTLSELKRINSICRENNIKFFCGDVYGMFGYLFADLQTHHYAEDVVKLPSGKSDKKAEPVKFTIKETATYVSLAKALSVDWSKSENAKKVNKMDYSYFLMRVLMEFRSKFNRKPDPKHRQADVEKLLSLSKTVLDRLNVPAEKIPLTIFNNLFAEISPVCAIVGGVAAQEVVKAVSQREAPHNNFFFFNPEKCVGFIEKHSSTD